MATSAVKQLVKEGKFPVYAARTFSDGRKHGIFAISGRKKDGNDFIADVYISDLSYFSVTYGYTTTENTYESDDAVEITKNEFNTIKKDYEERLGFIINIPKI